MFSNSKIRLHAHVPVREGPLSTKGNWIMSEADIVQGAIMTVPALTVLCALCASSAAFCLIFIRSVGAP